MKAATHRYRQSSMAHAMLALLLLGVSCAAHASRIQIDFHLEEVVHDQQPAATDVTPATGSLRLRFNAGAPIYSPTEPVEEVAFEGLNDFESSTTALIPWHPPLAAENQDPRDLVAFGNVLGEDFSYVGWLQQYRHFDGVNDYSYLITLDSNAPGTHVPALASAENFDEAALLDYLFAIQARNAPLLLQETARVFDGVSGELVRYDGITALAYIDAITVVPLPSMLLPSLLGVAGMVCAGRRRRRTGSAGQVPDAET